MPTSQPTKQLNYQEAASQPQNNLSEAEVNPPFWKTKSLEEMTEAEWESLCDGCGRCCLIKLEDEDTGDIAVTRLACRLLDVGSCRCSDYANRQSHVPDCVKLEPVAVRGLAWLPGTCAYRIVGEGRDLLWWHPLVSGRQETVHEAGVSVRGSAISESKVDEDRYPSHIIGWISKRRRKGRGQK
jgi:uncharacterized cysteine cluster protein YcgN (CxxCxxCC family)